MKKKDVRMIELLEGEVERAVRQGTPPDALISLGKVKGGKDLLRRARRAVAAHPDWRRSGNGFFYQSEARLPFCAVLGPKFAIWQEGALRARWQTVLIQYDMDDRVEGLAVEPGSGGCGRLARRLALDKQEEAALAAMLRAGSVLFAQAERRLDVPPAAMTPARSQARRVPSAYDEAALLEVLEALGQSGRELVLTGLLQQLSPLLPAAHRPCLVIELVSCGGGLSEVRRILGSVNFSSHPSGDGTAPHVLRIQGGEPLPNDAHMLLYQASGRKDPFHAALARADQSRGRSGAVACPFPAVPILLTDSCRLRGDVWCIEGWSGLPSLSSGQQDCLRAAASAILGRPKPVLQQIVGRVEEAARRPDAYRMTEVQRWRRAAVPAFLWALFRSPEHIRRVQALLLADEERAARQAETHREQIREALCLLDDLDSYPDGSIVPCPASWEEADAQLETAFAFRYRPSSSRTSRTGPFLCFSEASLSRLLQQNGIPNQLLEEVIRALRDDGRLRERTESVSFPKGKNHRYIKLDMSRSQGLLTCSRSTQYLQKEGRGV